MMVAGTKDTGGGKHILACKHIRPITEEEKRKIRRELRDDIEAKGEERDPTEEEVEGRVTKLLDVKKTDAERTVRRAGSCNKGIVDALEQLRESSKKSFIELQTHDITVGKQIAQLLLVIEMLEVHKDKRDALFDPLRSTDLPFSKKMGVAPIQRSVLYQRMNMLPKDPKDPKKALYINWNDKDQEASEGKEFPSDPLLKSHFKDDKARRLIKAPTDRHLHVTA